MNLADVLIVAVLVVSVVSAFAKGFFLEVFSLAGVVLGLFFAGAYRGHARADGNCGVSSPAAVVR
jgi:uncharacterized membrane protein required for colicin V production